jgi:hypothetical protein
MRRALLSPFPALMCLALLSACGYTLRGQEESRATHSALGDGSRTIKFLNVEQPTVQTNLTAIVRSLVRDEINSRSLAVWRDSGTADLGFSVRVDSFRIAAYGQSRSQNLLYTASITLEFLVYDGRTNNVAWRSGVIGYSEQYTNVNEETAVRELLGSVIRRGADRMQQRF